MAKTHLAHKRHHERTLTLGITDAFTPHRHNPTYLSQKIVSFSKRRGESLGRLQNLARNNFQTNEVFNLTNEMTHISKRTVISAYFHLFDELFFFGALQDCCKIVVDHGPWEEGKDGEIEFLSSGSSSPKGSILKKFLGKGLKSQASPTTKEKEKSNHAVIVLFKRDPKIEGRFDALHSYLDTLLHHMLHVFFYIYSCPSPECYRDWEAAGRGHGIAWQDAAHAIEVAVGDEGLLNLKMRLGRERGLVTELGRMEREIDWVRGELDGWGMKREELDELREGERKGWCKFDTK